MKCLAIDSSRDWECWLAVSKEPAGPSNGKEAVSWDGRMAGQSTGL